MGDFVQVRMLKVIHNFVFRQEDSYCRVNVWSTVKLSDAERNQLLNSRETSRSQFIASIFKTRKMNLLTFDGLILLSKADFESEYGQMVKSFGKGFTTCISTQLSENNSQIDLY